MKLKALQEKRFWKLVEEINGICKTNGYRCMFLRSTMTRNNAYFTLIFDSMYLAKEYLKKGHSPFKLKKSFVYTTEIDKDKNRYVAYLSESLTNEQKCQKSARLTFNEIILKE